MKRYIAIGDIHGCAKTFKKLLKQLDLGVADELILLGDMIDRGPDTKGVFDEIMRLRSIGYTVILIQGNHEEMMQMARMDFVTEARWLSNGGRAVVASFGKQHISEIGKEYWALFFGMQNYYEAGGCIFVHAGLNFSLPNPLEAVRDLRWIRDWYGDINYEWLGDRIIVHGHSPRSYEVIQAMQQNLAERQVLNIDSGCVFKYEGQGVLTAYDVTNKQLFFEKYIG